MPAVRGFSLALPLALCCCALPPRVEDRTSPKRAYETFRGAVARGEHEREFACLSKPLRRRLGISSRLEWRDARVVALTQGSAPIRAISRSQVKGEARMLDDGRALLELKLRYLVFGLEGRVWLRPVPVLRIYMEGSDRPEIYADLPGLRLERGPDGITVRVPARVLADFQELFEVEKRRVRAFEARIEWFLDDYELGSETPDTQRRAIKAGRE